MPAAAGCHSTMPLLTLRCACRPRRFCSRGMGSHGCSSAACGVRCPSSAGWDAGRGWAFSVRLPCCLLSLRSAHCMPAHIGLPAVVDSGLLPPPLRLFSSPCSSCRRYALPQQAALTIILLLYSRPMCASNTAIQMAYAALCGSLSRRASLVLGRLIQISSWSQLSRYYAAGRSCAAAVLAAPPQAREAVRAACLASAEAIADAAVVLEAEAAGQATNSAELCMRWQPLRCAGEGHAGCSEGWVSGRGTHGLLPPHTLVCCTWHPLDQCADHPAPQPLPARPSPAA